VNRKCAGTLFRDRVRRGNGRYPPVSTYPCQGGRGGLRKLLFGLLLMLAGVAFAEPMTFRVLCYHDVVQDVRDHPDPYAVDAGQLAMQFAWLKENGYRVVSLDDVIAAQQGRRPLPEKAVLLTFDDGYRSVYTRVYPLLKAFGYPALVALSGGWLDAASRRTVEYDGGRVARERFLSWGEIREMVASGLVEPASHTYALHRGIAANPQGSLIPAAVARHYDAQEDAYEDENTYLERLKADLARNSSLIEARVGKRPRVMIWPYGRDSVQAIEVARELGMPITMRLGGGANDLKDGLQRIKRDLIARNPPLRDFIPVMSKVPEPLPERVVHVDIDYVFDEDAGQQQRNLDLLLDRIKSMRVTTVYLQAYSDPDGNGQADALYFPNRHLPVRADLFSYVAWQLATRAEVKVYAWMPVLAFELPPRHPAAQFMVHSSDPAAPASGGRYRRLSPFSIEVRETIGEIFEDLARHARFDGLLFHDDAVLDDFEDASQLALQTYAQWGLPPSIEMIRRDPELLKEWTQRKTGALVAFTLELADRARRYQGVISTARNLYALPVMQPESQAWFAQSLPAFLGAYDYTAVMAMPFMEGAANPDAWLRELAQKVSEHPGALKKTVFELQTTDWRSGEPVATATLSAQMERLQRAGAVNFGYYPDDFLRDHPRFAHLKRAISLQTFPRED
jgi:biofilm PGA synthesis lipoprotein PgaB